MTEQTKDIIYGSAMAVILLFAYIIVGNLEAM